MRTLDVKELRKRLSEYLREVRRGESVLVTDLGQAIAELSPPRHVANDPDLPAALLALAKRGLVTLGSPNDNSLYEAMPRSRRGLRSAAQLLDEERSCSD
jgi:antitoxin (DNA-binding transcriptional repressor) of toxin-antitoxin stability system